MIGDARFLPLKDKSVNCIVTSPPYWSLRKYDILDLIWDGDESCEHKWEEKRVYRDSPTRGSSIESFTDCSTPKEQRWKVNNVCSKCGGWRGQLGLEPTIELYLKHLLECMDECWKVLRDDGTIWINMGDSYSSSGDSTQPSHKQFGRNDISIATKGHKAENISPKSLCLIPERFAVEMVNRGWILRNKIIWHKPNCMPASVKDRFTVDFEPVFFFVKSRKYWFEQQYEDFQLSSIQRINQVLDDQKGGPKEKAYLEENIIPCGGDKKLPSKILKRLKDGIQNKSLQGRNRRCVWTIATQPYPESHFATFPEALIEPMIKAGCPKEICVKCGKGREKIVKRKFTSHESETNSQYKKGSAANRLALLRQASRAQGEEYHQEIEDLGYGDCACNAGFRPGIVLDPFCGSGTVMAVAERLNRISIGFDLGYEDLQKRRMKNLQKQLLECA